MLIFMYDGWTKQVISHSNLKTNLIRHVCRMSLLIIAKLKKKMDIEVYFSKCYINFNIQE